MSKERWEMLEMEAEYVLDEETGMLTIKRSTKTLFIRRKKINERQAGSR